VIKRTVIAVITLVILLLAVMTWLTLESESALRWVVTRVETRYAGKFSVGSVNGTLMGPITLIDVQFNESAFDAHIRILTFDWRPLALLARRLDIKVLRAQDVEVQVKPRTQSAPFRFIRPRPPQLPVALVINDLDVSHLTLTTPNLAEPVVVDHASLTASLDNRAWAVHSLQAEGARVHIQGNGSWEFQRGEQVRAALQWQITLPQQPTFTGEAQAAGDEQRLQIHVSMSAPFRLRLTAGLQHLFTTPFWHGTLAFSELDPQRLRPGWSEMLARGELKLRGDPHATLLTGDINVHAQKYGDLRSHVDLRWADQILQVRTLDLERVKTATRFSLSGQVRYADGEVEPKLHGEWRALDLPLTGRPWLSSPRGKLDVSTSGERALLTLAGVLTGDGNFTAHGWFGLRTPHAWQLSARAQGFQLALEAIRNTAPLPPMNWQLQAHGDEAITQVDRFTGAWLSGRLQASGCIAHADGQPWQFDLQAQGINPAAIYPRFPGALTFTARISGHQGKQPAWRFQLTKLDGRLRAASIQASGILSHAAGSWQLQAGDARIGHNRLQLNGRFGKQPHFDWKLYAPKLAMLWPDIQGSLVSEGQADLSGAIPTLAFTLTGAALHYRNYALGKITANVSMNDAHQAGHATLGATGLQFKNMKIDALTALAMGSLNAYTFTANASSLYGKAAFAGSGAFANNIWRGNFTEIKLTPQGAGEWRNTAPWQARIAAGHFTLANACVLQVTARACLQADWQPAQWQAEAMLTAVPMRDLQTLLPEGLEYEGSFGGMLHVLGTDNTHSLDLTASLSPGTIYNVINHRRVSLLAYTGGSVSIHSDTNLITGRLDWTLKDGGFMNINSQITDGENPALSGSIQGELHNFDLVPVLIPEVGGLQGKLKINLTLSGTPSDPLFSGTASLADGAVMIPRLGLHVNDVLLSMDGNGDHLTLDGKARSGNGNLEWQSTAVQESGMWHAHGKLSGTNFRVADIPEARIDVSPALNFKFDNRDVYLDGIVNVPYAKLRPRDLTHTAQVSPDQVIVGKNGEQPRERWRVHAQVRVNMGENVNFAGFGLTSHIAGSVLAVDEPGHYTTGSGELQIVNGQYTAYGQKLKIERGRLMFNGGPISDPALDIRAIRPPAHSETVLPGNSEQVVGVQVRGALHNPKITLFSDPPLPQAQLLTYLLTGQAPVSQSQSPVVGPPPTGTDSSLALTGGQLFAQEVGQHVGIEDVGVQNVSTGPGTSTAAMFFGKYLSPRLYISYGVGLLQPLNTVRIRYTLSTRWMLEAESGSFANGADLIYTIER